MNFGDDVEPSATSAPTWWPMCRRLLDRGTGLHFYAEPERDHGPILGGRAARSLKARGRRRGSRQWLDAPAASARRPAASRRWRCGVRSSAPVATDPNRTRAALVRFPDRGYHEPEPRTRPWRPKAPSPHTEMPVTPHVPGTIPVTRYQIPADSLQCGMYGPNSTVPGSIRRPAGGIPRRQPDRAGDPAAVLPLVHVDPFGPTRSVDAIRRAELTDDPFERPSERADEPLRFDTVLDDRSLRQERLARPVRIRSDVKISNQTRERFRRFIKATAVASDAAAARSSIVDRTFGWLRGLLGQDPDSDEVRASLAQARNAIRGQLPPEARLRRYADRASIEDELPRDREAFANATRQLRAMTACVRERRAPDVHEFGRAVDEMVDSMIDNPDALMWVARLDDGERDTSAHGLRVAMCLVALGRHLGLPRRELAHLGTIVLADVGKARCCRRRCSKPGMRRPQSTTSSRARATGPEALHRDMRLAQPVEQGIAQHHERLDGTGYPKGLRGEEIGVFGRMAAIADSFAALIAVRAYANASAPQDALMNLYEWAGTSFDEPLVEQFVQAIGLLPVGSLVELSTGEVSRPAHNRVRRLEPRVMVLTARTVAHRGTSRARPAGPTEGPRTRPGPHRARARGRRLRAATGRAPRGPVRLRRTTAR